MTVFAGSQNITLHAVHDTKSGTRSPGLVCEAVSGTWSDKGVRLPDRHRAARWCALEARVDTK